MSGSCIGSARRASTVGLPTSRQLTWSVVTRPIFCSTSDQWVQFGVRLHVKTGRDEEPHWAPMRPIRFQETVVVCFAGPLQMAKSPSPTCPYSAPTTRVGYGRATTLPVLTGASGVSGCTVPANMALPKVVHPYQSRRTLPGGLSSPFPFNSWGNSSELQSALPNDTSATSAMV